MEIRNLHTWKQDAAGALAVGREPKKVVLAYAGISTLVVAVLTGISYFLSAQLSQAGGLSNLGNRGILQTIQSCLPIVQLVLTMGLELGYLYAMLRIARKQYADHTDLKVGFRRLAPMGRLALILFGIYFALCFGCYYASYMLYLFTPWGMELLEKMMPLVEDMSVLNTAPQIDEAMLATLTEAVMPLMVVFLVVFGVVGIIFSYQYRMAVYSLLDDPNPRAMAAIRASRRMMRGNWKNLFRLDGSFWWYYGATVLLSVLAYGDLLLEMLGVRLPMDPMAASLLFYAIYLALQFALTYFCRNRVECSYIMAYESLCEKPKDNGVVLGNIFQM